MFKIKGSSGTPPPPTNFEYGILELESFAVNDCLSAFNAVKCFVMGQYPGVTRLDDKFEFSFYMNPGKTNQLVNKIKDVIVGGTENGWMTICTRDPGFVYIVKETIPIHFYFLGEGYVYQIMGSSGIPRVAMDNHPATVEIQKIAIKDCLLAIHSVMHDLAEISGTSSGIIGKPGYGMCAFAVATARYDNFLTRVKYATFPVLAEIPPNDWLPCPNTIGYLYIVRISQRVDTNQEYEYSCHRVFGSQLPLNISDNNNIITSPYFTYSFISGGGLTNCAAALKKSQG